MKVILFQFVDRHGTYYEIKRKDIDSPYFVSPEFKIAAQAIAWAESKGMEVINK